MEPKACIHWLDNRSMHGGRSSDLETMDPLLRLDIPSQSFSKNRCSYFFINSLVYHYIYIYIYGISYESGTVPSAAENIAVNKTDNALALPGLMETAFKCGHR